MSINFFYEEENIAKNTIISSSHSIPEWYRKIPLYVNEENEDDKLPSVKHCFPFIEAVTAGYLLLTDEEYVIKQAPEGMLVTTSSGTDLHPRYKTQNSEPPRPHGYYSLKFPWQVKLSIEIPEGYSCLFTQPLNRFDLPFFSYSAIIDGHYIMPPGIIAFSIREDFEGVIPIGTPFIQIIPFKKEEFILQRKDGLIQSTQENFNEIRKDVVKEQWRAQKENYRKNHWKKKSYKIDDIG
jgi:hypothetical protein